MRAGDGNRTRTISLGICAIRACIRPDLHGRQSASDRKIPLVTVVNGPLMAQRSRADLRLDRIGDEAYRLGQVTPRAASSDYVSRPPATFARGLTRAKLADHDADQSGPVRFPQTKA